MKNILLIIQNLNNGGAERAITLLANTLSEKNNVTMVVFDERNNDYEPNVKTINLKSPESNNLFKKLFHLIYRIKRLKKIKKEQKIDCSISFLPGPNLVNCLSKEKDKTIISIRNMQSKLKKNKLRDIVNQITLKKANRVVTVSKDVKQDILKHYKVDVKKITTIYNMIDSEYIEQKRKERVEEKIFSDNSIKLINIGRLIKQKGQWHLIKAFKVINDKYPNSKLLILGRGELEEDFNKIIKDYNLENNVFLLGYKKNPYKYLTNSDIFISTSLYEGMSNVILEAMACKLPIIATDCPGGTREILFDDTKKCKYGIIIKNFSNKYNIKQEISEKEIQLANEIENFITDKNKLNKYKKLSEKRVQNFSNKEIIKKWEKIIE